MYVRVCISANDEWNVTRITTIYFSNHKTETNELAKATKQKSTHSSISGGSPPTKTFRENRSPLSPTEREESEQRILAKMMTE